MRKETIINTAIRVLVIGSGVVGMMQTIITTPLSGKAFGNFTWGQVVIAVFIISAFYVFGQLEMSYRRLINAKPEVKTIIPPSPDNFSLEIKNIGGDGEFKVEVEVIEGVQNLMEKTTHFFANWEDTNEIQRPLLKWESKRIDIAHLVNGGAQLELTSRNLQNDTKHYIPA